MFSQCKKMAISKLETTEATFVNHSRDGMHNHFVINCACNGKDGNYHGSHYKNAGNRLEETTRSYTPFEGSKSDHTYYFSEMLFLLHLRMNHQESPLVIVCNDCAREFPFTLDSYLNLKSRMIPE